jgi:hypothetical protein
MVSSPSKRKFVCALGTPSHRMICAATAEGWRRPGPEGKANQLRSKPPHSSPPLYSERQKFGQLTNLTVCVHSRAASDCLILNRMNFVHDKQTDFSVVIKSRSKPPNPWRWEIYRAGHSRPVAQSTELFSTVSAAKKAGDRALAELFEKHLIHC